MNEVDTAGNLEVQHSELEMLTAMYPGTKNKNSIEV